MGVYIKGMEMPKNCRECIFYSEGYDEDGEYLSPICVPTQLLYEVGCALNRASYCPLVEVPEPHGRLIDADALRETIVPMAGMWDGDTFWISYDAVLRIIDNASTVIEGSDE